MNSRIDSPSRLRFTRLWRAGLLAVTLTLASCGGGGGDEGTDPPDPPDPPPVSGDDARRAVLKDIGEEIILPSLRDFDIKATALKAAADALVAAPADAVVLTAAQTAWRVAMVSWQRNEVLQIGPAGKSTNPDQVAGGQDFRDQIYPWPLILDVCGVELAANSNEPVDANTPRNLIGLGAIEHLLFTAAPPVTCAAQPDAAHRAQHVQRLAGWVAPLATALRNRWEPGGGNFLLQWSTAGLPTSQVYARPQDALNAISVALFYFEKTTKDRKVAYTTGLPASGLVCANPSSCPEYLESRLSRHSGANLVANLQAFKDMFTGVNGKLGMNSLLTGIGRNDLATEIVNELNAAQAQLNSIEAGAGFDAAVEGIPSRAECTAAFNTATGVPPCVLMSLLKTATDTFRGPIVAALSLTIPDSAAGDND